MARIECSHCDRTAQLTTDQFDKIVDDAPELEIEPGVIMAKCTAWPKDVLEPDVCRFEGCERTAVVTIDWVGPLTDRCCAECAVKWLEALLIHATDTNVTLKLSQKL